MNNTYLLIYNMREKSFKITARFALHPYYALYAVRIQSGHSESVLKNTSALMRPSLRLQTDGRTMPPGGRTSRLQNVLVVQVFHSVGTCCHLHPDAQLSRKAI